MSQNTGKWSLYALNVLWDRVVWSGISASPKAKIWSTEGCFFKVFSPFETASAIWAVFVKAAQRIL